MKTLAKLLFVALIVMACVEMNHPRKPEPKEFDIEISEVEFDGHKYLVFEGYGVEHDPNCPCQRVSGE